MADEFSPEELAMLLRLREERKITEALEPWMEQRRCKQWGLLYDEENPAPHRLELDRRDAALRDFYAQHTRNWRWIGVAGRAVGAGSASVASKVWNGLVGAVSFFVLGWVATKLGLKIPGISP